MQRLLPIWVAALSSAALAGCAGTASVYCPPLKSYAAVQQKALAREFASLPTEARQDLNDYGLLRRECRAIKN